MAYLQCPPNSQSKDKNQIYDISHLEPPNNHLQMVVSIGFQIFTLPQTNTNYYSIPFKSRYFWFVDDVPNFPWTWDMWTRELVSWRVITSATSLESSRSPFRIFGQLVRFASAKGWRRRDVPLAGRLERWTHFWLLKIRDIPTSSFLLFFWFMVL